MSILVRGKAQKKRTLTDLLHMSLSGHDEQRTKKWVHASELTKPGFCSRAHCLQAQTGKRGRRSFVTASMRVTFDIGWFLQDYISECLKEYAWGDWKCCHLVGTSCKHDEITPCSKCSNPPKYEEARFYNPNTHISCGVDLILDLNEPKLRIVEIKTIKPEDFKKLAAPLAEHRLRTTLYMHTIENSEHPSKDLIDTTKATVIYVTKGGYGCKHSKHGFSPFKEYDISYDSALIEPYVKMGKYIAGWVANKTNDNLPGRICPTQYTSDAKYCPVVEECFSCPSELLELE